MRRRDFVRTTAVTAVATGLTKSTKAAPTDRPNILWLTCEDNNITWLGCYGNPHADTPTIDKLAAEGFQYMHAFASAPVCAPSRCTWITGINAVSMGTHPMRSRHDIPHTLIKYYPDHLKKAGYYTCNAGKTDYNIGGRSDKECWMSTKLNWETLKQNQPFFQVINTTASHESKAFGDIENTDHDPAKVKLRKYHPDVPDMRKNYAHYHDAIKNMDSTIAKSLAKLEASGMAENTIVIHNSDHGGVLPRSKRYLFSSGLHCPLIIRIPEKYKHLWPAEKPGMKVDRIVSYVDMPTTWLSLAGANIPKEMQGEIFLGPQTGPERKFHFAFRGRMDERLESARAVSNKQYLYIRNYMPYVPWMQHLTYLWQMKATQAWVKAVEDGTANETQTRFFKAKGWTEELYDIHKDPDSVNNLIDNPEHRELLKDMRTGLRSWQEQIHDAGMLPESEMIKLAADNNTTIYEAVRNPKLYNLPALLDAADVALEENPANLPTLKQMLESPNLGIRYWGTVGCHLLGSKAASTKRKMIQLQNDPSHEVRAMAAWNLINLGEKETGLQALEKLLKDGSYATLKVLNMIDWIGDDAKSLIPTVAELNAKNYEARMRDVLLVKNGLKKPESKKNKSKKKKKA